MSKVVKYDDPKVLAKAIDKYFAETTDEKLTLTGLIKSLGVSKGWFYDRRNNEIYGEIIEAARLTVENSYEMLLKSGKNTVGAIFALKQFGWVDRQEIDQRVLNATVVLELTDERRKALVEMLQKKLPGVKSGE